MSAPRFFVALTLLVGAIAPGFAVAETVIGILRDGPQARVMIPQSAIEAEVAKLTADEFDVRFPADKSLEGDWTLEGARAVFDRQLADPDVDIVLCLGMLVCHVAGDHPGLNKPVIAPIVVDPELQSFPFADGASGKRNLVYITNLHSVDDDLRDFAAATSFKKLASLVDQPTIDAFQSFLEQKVAAVEEDLGIQ
ncbi:MAG: hypothetical protein ACN4GT_11865, partial [Gammaproteobacteria bacterium]